MKANHSDRRRSTRRLFDEREQSIRRQLAGHALFILTLLFIIQGGVAKFTVQFLAKPFEAWMLICIVTYVVICLEMLIRQVMFSRMQSPIVFTVLFLLVTVLSFLGAGLAFTRGQHFTHNGILSTGGFRLIVGVMFCMLVGITIIGSRQERITDLETTNSDKEKSQKRQDNMSPGAKKTKQSADEREMQLGSIAFPIGLILLIVVTGINALLVQLGICWAPPFEILVMQLVLVYTTVFVIQLYRGAIRHYTIYSIILIMNYLNLGLLGADNGTYEVLKGQKPFLQQNHLSEEGVDLVMALLFTFGAIVILLVYFHTKARLKREESE
jgi:hypothetical protein